MIKRAFPIAVALMFASGAAFAANDAADPLNSLDANGDGKVSKDEFYAYYDNSDAFDTWDVDGDGAINDEEFADGLYDHFDDNDDGYVSDAEWEDGIMVDDYGDNGFWDL